jgi:hypothetical protein
MRTDTIPSRLLFTTLRIEADDGRVGTGVICSHPVSQTGMGSFLVTNKHVVRDSHCGSLTFSIADADGQPLPDHSYKLPCSGKAWEWTGHPDAEVDVAAISISRAVDNLRGQGHNIYYKAISRDIVLAEEQTRDMDAVEEVWMVGYPNGIYDQVNNLPVVRRGITATPYAVDYEAKPQFLIDASVFPGSSGSPVYLYDPLGMRRGSDGVLSFGGAPRIFFLGILSSGYRRTDGGKSLAQPTNAVVSSEMLDLGIVCKARTVIQTIEHLLVLAQT